MRFVALLLSLALFSGTAYAVPTTLTVVNVAETNALFADNAADTANGNRMLNPNCDLVLLLHNSHATNSSTVTVTAQATSVTFPGYGPMTKANQAITLAAGAKRHAGPFPCPAWNDSSGYVQLTFTGTGTVLVTPVRVPRG